MRLQSETTSSGWFTSKAGAFSLIELLAVIALLLILGVAVASMGPGILQGRDLVEAREIIKGQLLTARQHAFSKGQMTMLVVRTSGEKAWQRTSVFAADPRSQTWTQVDAWKELPGRVFLDPGYDPASEPWGRPPMSLASAHPTTPAPTVPIRDAGVTLSPNGDYVSLAFYPGAGLMVGTNVALRVASGQRTGQTVEMTGGAQASNWIKFVVEHVTGQIKELEP
jgi:type II secretory pathway pseudopilin PulG